MTEMAQVRDAVAEIAGERLVMLPERALYWERARTLLNSDWIAAGPVLMNTVYVVIWVAWAAAVAWSVRAYRRDKAAETAEAAEASMEARRVRSALEELTKVQREALELAYFGGYTHTEVATMLDLPVGTAKTRIRDGLIRMRDAMGVGTA